jgi:hypothetical protein
VKRVVEASVLGLRLENCHFTLHRIRSFAGDSAETMMGIDEDEFPLEKRCAQVPASKARSSIASIKRVVGCTKKKPK